jgi:rare lipoprotein A
MTRYAIPATEDGKRLMLRAGLLSLVAASLAACASAPKPQLGAGGEPTSRYAGYKVGKPYQVKGVWYYPKDQPTYDEIGIASWYGEQFHNHYTADGEIFDMGMPSAAHKTLPLPSLVEVTNLANGRTVIVRVNDRGPFVEGRVIDMSRAAAEELGFVAQGVTKVRVRYVGQANAPPEPKLQQALDHLPKPKAPSLNLGSKALQVAENAIPHPPLIVPVPLAVPVIIPPLGLPPEQAMAVAAVAPVTQAALAAIPASGAPSYVAAAPVAAPAAIPMAQAAVHAAAPSASAGALPDVDSLLADAPPAAQTASVASAVQAAAPAAAAAAPAALQVQAGVFASRANAELLASRLTGAGTPQVEPFERAGQTFYRVTVRGFSTPEAAAAARTQAASFGAPDARVIGGL